MKGKGGTIMNVEREKGEREREEKRDNKGN
jgi:hypothetical protein